jgi:mannitol/fructose-specific phosphotransferase system IIA component (Ntr-type)
MSNAARKLRVSYKLHMLVLSGYARPVWPRTPREGQQSSAALKHASPSALDAQCVRYSQREARLKRRETAGTTEQSTDNPPVIVPHALEAVTAPLAMVVLRLEQTQHRITNHCAVAAVHSSLCM